MIIVDVGMGFPEESVYGVDVSVPDFGLAESKLEEHDLLGDVLLHRVEPQRRAETLTLAEWARLARALEI